MSTWTRTLLRAALFFGVSLAPVLPQSAEHKAIDVQELLAWCKKLATPSIEATFCAGYISGTAEHMFWLSSFAAQKHEKGLFANSDDRIAVEIFSACTRDQKLPSTQAMVLAFVNWAEKHPGDWGLPISVAVNNAIAEAWHCDNHFQAIK